MPREIGSVLRQHKNELRSTDAVLIAYECTTSDGSQVLRLVDNPENVDWGDPLEKYYGFPIVFDALESNSEADLPRVQISVANVTREVAAIVRRSNSFIDASVIIRVISKRSTADSRPWGPYRIGSATISREAVVFELASNAEFDQTIPGRDVVPVCGWEYRKEECGFPEVADLPSGVPDFPTCSKLLFGPNGCNDHGLAYTVAGHEDLREWPKRWGGFDVAISR